MGVAQARGNRFVGAELTPLFHGDVEFTWRVAWGAGESSRVGDLWDLD